MAFWLGRALLDKQGNNRWHSWRYENKVLYEPQDACNKDLKAKEKAVELTVSVSGKF